MDADERRRFGESFDGAEAASVGRARAARGGRIEVTVEELAQVLGCPRPPDPSAGDTPGYG
ncbi:hypothetical protein [Streptomyces reniochalinae]|uniref:hypothetical protein n=1 Tax=Streptomyces reniochalinae TaxID=2250578 RepID=UPI0011C0577B|nr:hypothetical protein [Streptomyces reniochalinae]